LIVATRLLSISSNNDQCSDFFVFGIPTIVLFVVFCAIGCFVWWKKNRG